MQGLFERLEHKIWYQLRFALDCNEQASAGRVDSQSVKTTDRGSVKGYDGCKKIKGRKRHVRVDTQRLILSSSVTAANETDRKGLHRLLGKIPTSESRLKKKYGLI